VKAQADYRPEGSSAVRLGRWLADNVAENLLDFVFPSRCVGCGSFYADLCSECVESLDPIREPICPRCGRPEVRSSLTGWCEECVGREQAFVQARSAFVYDGVARALVTAVKFGGRQRLVGALAELATRSFAELIDPLDSPVVTWVPAYPAAERRRGFNQAEHLARSLVSRSSQQHAPPLARLVQKTRTTAHQQALGREERARNLEGAFRPVRERRFPGARNVVVVDDVFTTGSTADAVSRAVRRQLDVPVHVFTFARALGSHKAHLD
jgi:ComF family protein